MAKVTVHGLRGKPAKDPKRWFWEPSATLKRAGWKSLPLGTDYAAAIRAAQARNEEVAAWRNGGTTPRQIERFARRATVSALIKRYKAERLPEIGSATAKTYGSALVRLERWAGDTPASAITRKNVRDLRDAMLAPKSTVGRHAAHTTLKMGRTLFKWGIGRFEGLTENPFAAFDMATPDPRHQIWDDADIAAFVAAANTLGHPAMGYAVELAAWTGQREADLIRLTVSQYTEMPPIEEHLRAALAGTDGRVMAISLRQGKTQRWIGVPLTGAIRAATEAAIARDAARDIPSGRLLTSDRTGLPWQQRNFIRIFSQVQAHAVVNGRPELAELQFRDLRRTCVVRLGRRGLNDAQISAISGHKLETTKRILETYMPRDHAMAASAIVATIGGAASAKAAKAAKV